LPEREFRAAAHVRTRKVARFIADKATPARSAHAGQIERSAHWSPKPQSNQEVQLFPNVNATIGWGTVQNVVAVNVPRAAEQVHSGNVAKGAHRAVLMAGSWTNP
jgi:hypothetical protein